VATPIVEMEREVAAPPQEPSAKPPARGSDHVEARIVEPSTAPSVRGIGKMEPRSVDAPDSSMRVARWLVLQYGKSDAERQAAQAVTYYPANDERTEHWRRVLGHLRATN
jgi:hypothetical protein